MIENPLLFIPETWGHWEVRADRQWLYVRQKNRATRIPLSDLHHCIVSGDNGYLFRIITRSSQLLEFSVRGKSRIARQLYAFLEPYCDGFRSIRSTYTPWAWKCGIYQFRLDRNELAVDYPRMFHKEMKPFYRIPVREIVWLSQLHSVSDPEAPDSYHLRVYTANGKWYDLEGENVQNCYDMAKLIKDNAPQARYCVDAFTGPSGVTDTSWKTEYLGCRFPLP